MVIITIPMIIIQQWQNKNKCDNDDDDNNDKWYNILITIISQLWMVVHHPKIKNHQWYLNPLWWRTFLFN